MYPKIGTLANALETVTAEKANRLPLPDDWEAPDPVFQKWQLVHAFHWSQQAVQRTDEQFGGDLLTHEYWKNWVENRLFQDAQDESQSEQQQPSGPRRLSRGQINAQRSRIPVPEGMSDEELARFMGVEMLPDA